ncbi:hypothetical protein FDA94_01550 [Herbidospora galbida]|uniref:Uncharacterized protein n=1 Tax=Herbidospora galbida TaxID=2575442 RepID=A0A4U3MPF2_9ACTN|nr:hypothetical protein [Herbidospora galbida]TKK91495.1 hypothetical protein FDA94_01550 [Herbidospora galbida]
MRTTYRMISKAAAAAAALTLVVATPAAAATTTWGQCSSGSYGAAFRGTFTSADGLHTWTKLEFVLDDGSSANVVTLSILDGDEVVWSGSYSGKRPGRVYAIVPRKPDGSTVRTGAPGLDDRVRARVWFTGLGLGKPTCQGSTLGA